MSDIFDSFDEGWISLHRKIMKNWIWENPQYLKAWTYILFKANHKRNKVLLDSHIEYLERTEFITSRSRFAKDTGLSIQSTRTFLSLLKKDKMIDINSTNKLTRITVLNYDNYQPNQPAGNQQATSKQPAGNQQATTDNNNNNVNNKKEKLIKRKEIFQEEVMTFKEKYPNDMLVDFIRYWTEPQKSWLKMKFELQQTWSLAGRLATWWKNYKKNLPPGGISPGSRSIDKIPPGYGVPNPKAITREQFIKEKQQRNESDKDQG